MDAHPATSAGRARATPAFDDAWLRMRRAPVCGAHRSAFGGAAVRDALRTIASARPDPAALALKLGEVRALLDRQRGMLQRRLAAGALFHEIARAETRLLDDTLIGLCHLGRLLEARSAGRVPPLAVLARGAYGRRKLAPGTSPGLLFLMPGDPVLLEQGLALTQFVARALAGLDWQALGTKRTVRGCLTETLLDPALATDLSAARLVWGCGELFAELRTGLLESKFRGEARIRLGTSELLPAA